MKKLFLVVVLCFISGLIGIGVIAADVDTGEVLLEDKTSITASGECGDNLTWTLYDNGELVIVCSSQRKP